MIEFIKVFWLVFLAKLGDKTQLVCLASSSAGKPFLSFLGGSSALVSATAIACFLGGILNKLIPVCYIKPASGISFIGVGLWLLFTWRSA